MKKYILLVAAVMCQLAAQAQTVNVHFKNGQKIQFPSVNVDYVDFSEKAPDPTVSAGAVVDLGLSVYWCSCNVGAESPEEYGDYYAWGETKPKSSYRRENYSYYNTETETYTDIGENISGTEYDAATVNLGSDWKMPTKDEFQELLDNCTWEWTQISGVNGYKITGSNGNSIFIPATGTSVTGTRYYTGTDAKILYAYSGGKYISNQKEFRYEGCLIRPVTTNPNAQGGPVDHSNDYLVTDKISASFAGGAISSINGRILPSSSLNVRFTNGSEEPVTLIGVQLYEQGSTDKGSNILKAEEDVAAGENKTYTLTLNTSMTTPVVCFTYRYNKKKYTVEATYSSSL
ncbi:MAG: hypothetical protein J5932_04985 [Prevotella sp.]|nr:hypothetical protein [Prevotella sp.]